MKHTSWVVVRSGDMIALAERVSMTKPIEMGLFGGNLNDNEKFDAGAQRELREEAGLDVPIDRLVPKANLLIGSHTMHVYEVAVIDPVFKLNAEHKAVKWYTIDEAKQLPLHWCAKHIISKVY